MPRHYILILLFCLHTLCAQASDTINYDNQSGLSHWIVSDVIQDSNGFMWMSTWNGLNRYDGYTFRHVRTQPGDGTDITSEVIRYVLPDDDGNIRCITDDGVFVLDTHTYKFKDVTDGASSGIGNDNSNNMLVDREGNVWQLQRYGIRKITQRAFPAKVVSGTETVQARAFFRNEKTKQWWLATKEDECIRVYDSQNSFVGYLGNDGVIHAEKQAFGYRPYCITQASNGDIWMGCKPGALLRLREQADGTYEVRRILCRGLTSDVIYDIVEDDARRLWLATFGDGLQCMPNPSSDAPQCISFLDRSNGIFEKGKSKIRRLLLTRSGNIVCATTNGIVTAKVEQQDVRHSIFRRIVRDGKDANSLCGNAATDVFYGMQGEIFIATEYSGIDMTTEESLFSDSPSFRHFNTKNSSLTSDICLAAVMKPDGRMLIVSSDRVTDFCPYTGDATTFSRRFWSEASHFSESRPMPLYDSSWVFGQEQGAYIVTDSVMQSRCDVPPLQFTELYISGRQPRYDVCGMTEITLSAHERSMELSFAALDYTDNADIMYRTRIRGRSWQRAGQGRTISFHDMQPGTFTIEIQSTDRYGRWVSNNRTITVTVEPHWYETLWARILAWVASVAAVLGVAYVLFYVRQLKQQRSKLLNDYMLLLKEQHQQSPAERRQEHTLPVAGLSESDRRFLERVRRYVQGNIANSDANIDDMASCVATSRSNLNRKLRSLLGVTAVQLLIEARMQRAQQLLAGRDTAEKFSMSEVAYRCGYSDAKYFSRSFKQKYGVSPSEYSQGKGCDEGAQEAASKE